MSSSLGLQIYQWDNATHGEAKKDEKWHVRDFLLFKKLPCHALQNKRDWYRHSHYCWAAYTSHNRMEGTIFHEWCGDSKSKGAWTNMHLNLIFLLSFVHLFMDFCKDVRDKGSCREKNRSNRGAVIIRADSLTHPSSTLEK